MFDSASVTSKRSSSTKYGRQMLVLYFQSRNQLDIFSDSKLSRFLPISKRFSQNTSDSASIFFELDTAFSKHPVAEETGILLLLIFRVSTYTILVSRIRKYLFSELFSLLLFFVFFFYFSALFL